MSLPEGWADGLTEEQIYARGRAELDRLEAEGDAMFAEVYRKRGWTEEQIAKHQAHVKAYARTPECAEQSRKALVAFEAKVKARLADPEITWEDEIIPYDPAFTADSIADFKRFERRRP